MVQWIILMEFIHAMNLSQVDLNLLTTLQALLAERSVTRAARRLGLSQPAVSNALARLRELFADPLLLRGRGPMTPTPRAQELEPLLQEALAAVDRVVTRPAPFVPATATQRFTCAATDYIEMVLLPAVTQKVSAAAPGVTLDVRPIGENSPLEFLSTGALDIALGVFIDVPQGFHRQPLLQERFRCVVRRGHPVLRKRPLTLERYAAMSHVLVAPRRTGPAAVDTALARHGLSRHIALYVSHFLVAPLVVAETDLIVTLPERVALLFAERLELALIDPPVPLSTFPLALMWHQRTHDSAPHRWLREQIVAASREQQPVRRRATKQTGRAQKTRR